MQTYYWECFRNVLLILNVSFKIIVLICILLHYGITNINMLKDSCKEIFYNNSLEVAVHLTKFNSAS